ncbi:MAG: rod shape-determining protein MreD [Lachnospiraceae bacterium]|nr:rod shape-determining protein MreD [Lachnospiraceae bacterium]
MKILSFIKRTIIILLLILFAFILQNTFSLYMRSFSIIPNFLIILTCIFGYMNGKTEGMFIGFVAGLLVDILAADVIGMNALLYLYVGYFSGIFNRLFYSDMIWLPLSIIGIGDFIYNFGYYVIRFVLRNKLDVTFYMKNIMIPELIFTVFAGFILFKLLYAINTKWLYKERRSTLNFD